ALMSAFRKSRPSPSPITDFAAPVPIEAFAQTAPFERARSPPEALHFFGTLVLIVLPFGKPIVVSFVLANESSPSSSVPFRSRIAGSMMLWVEAGLAFLAGFIVNSHEV